MGPAFTFYHIRKSYQEIDKEIDSDCGEKLQKVLFIVTKILLHSCRRPNYNEKDYCLCGGNPLAAAGSD